MCNKIGKKLNLFNTMLALFAIWLINFFGGTNFPFSIVLFFLLLFPFILFGVVEIQKNCIENKCVLILFGFIWLAPMLFWALNFWTIVNPIFQPYLLIQS